MNPFSSDAQPCFCSIYYTFLHIIYCTCFILCCTCPSTQIMLIASIRGKPKLVNDGYTYVYHKKRESGYIAWRCDQNNKAARDKGSACPSTAVTTGMTSTSTLEYSRHHYHPPPTGRFGALILRNNPNTAATSDRTVKPHRILGDTLSNVPEHVDRSLHFLHIPRSLLSPWKVFDSGPSDTRIFVLTFDSNLDFLKAAPKLSTQLYTIYGQKSGYTIHGVYALLPNKRKETYGRLFTQVKSWVTASAPRWEFETFLFSVRLWTRSFRGDG